jgi:hypothetical protein
MIASLPTYGPGSGQVSAIRMIAFRVVQLAKGIHVAGVPRLEQGPHNLHVLLVSPVVGEAGPFQGRFGR